MAVAGLRGIRKLRCPCARSSDTVIRWPQAHDDVRHPDIFEEVLVGGRSYAVAIMDNHLREILASAVTAEST